MWAAAKDGCYRAVVQYLIERGANPNGVEGKNPLQAAASAGNINIVQYLIEHGADKFLNDSAEQARRNGHRDTARYIFDVLARKQQEREREEQGRRAVELEQQRQRMEEERRRQERELEQKRQQEQEEREQKDRELIVHRNWLSEHPITVQNLQGLVLAHFAGSLDVIIDRYRGDDSATKRRRWELVRDGIEGLLPQENKQRLEQLPDKSQYTILARIFHPDKVQTARPDLVPYTDRIFKTLNVAYNAMSS